MNEWTNWIEWVKTLEKLKTPKTRSVTSSESGSNTGTMTHKGKDKTPFTPPTQAMVGGEMRLL